MDRSLALVLALLALVACSSALIEEPGDLAGAPTEGRLHDLVRELAAGRANAATIWGDARWRNLRDTPGTRKALGRVLRDHAGPQATIAPAEEPGRRLQFRGRVVDGAGAPVAAAWVYLYQAADDGRYAPEATARGEGDANPRLFAWLCADADGRFVVDTILPGPYGGAPPHFHFGLTRDPARGGRGSRVYFDDGSPMHPEIAEDAAAGHAYIARLDTAGGRLEAEATFLLRD